MLGAWLILGTIILIGLAILRDLYKGPEEEECDCQDEECCEQCCPCECENISEGDECSCHACVGCCYKPDSAS
jgi:hypothetical protein